MGKINTWLLTVSRVQMYLQAKTYISWRVCFPFTTPRMYVHLKVRKCYFSQNVTLECVPTILKRVHKHAIRNPLLESMHKPWRSTPPLPCCNLLFTVILSCISLDLTRILHLSQHQTMRGGLLINFYIPYPMSPHDLSISPWISFPWYGVIYFLTISIQKWRTNGITYTYITPPPSPSLVVVSSPSLVVVSLSIHNNSTSVQASTPIYQRFLPNPNIFSK